MDPLEEDGDFLIESLSESEVEVVELLKSIELSEAVVDAFIENGYTVDILKQIERKEIEELIRPPLLAERTKCICGLNAWRKSLNLPLITDPTTSTSALNPPEHLSKPPTQSEIADITRAECTATYLLHMSARGEAIIKKYQSSKQLTRSDKRSITQIVVDGFKDRFSKLSAAELQERATELRALFPNEPQDTWYQPAWTTDGSGRRVKLRKQAKGTLRDRNINYKEERLECVFQAAGQVNIAVSENPGPSNTITQEDLTEYQRTKKWIIHNQDDWDEVKNKWKQTTRPRLFEILGNEKRNTATLLAEYPVLRHHQGYQLVQIDFLQHYPEKEKLLFDRWEEFLCKVQPVLEAEVTDAVGKTLLNYLKADEISNDGRGLITIWLLIHILPSPILRISDKNRWKPSIIESRESVAVLIKDLVELQTTLGKILKTFQVKKIDLAPFIVVHGEDPKTPTSFTVWNNVVSYKLPSFPKALDVCLKLYKSYGIAFPRQSSQVWNLLANVLFDFDIPLEQTSVIALSTLLRNSLQQPRQEE